jgi:hypothetical protein
MMKNLKSSSFVLVVLVFIAPVLGTGIASIGLSDEASQYSGVQGAVMGVYNLPFFLASLVTAVMGNNALRRGNENLAKKLFFASILSSVVGTLLMLAWGLGILA